MNEIQNKTDRSLQATRRRFLTAAGRTAALAVLGGLGAALIWKRTILTRAGACPDPAGQSGCDRCGAYASCSLPRAISARRIAENSHGQTKP